MPRIVIHPFFKLYSSELCLNVYYNFSQYYPPHFVQVTSKGNSRFGSNKPRGGHLATLAAKIHQYNTVGCMLAQETYTIARAVKVNRVVSCGDVAVIQSSHTKRYRYVCSCPWRCNDFYIPHR